MILLVCGGRDYNDEAAAFAALDKAHARRPVTVLVQGGAKGGDALGKRWALSRGIHCAEVPALWGVHGNAAGPKRNEAMRALKPDAVVAFPGGRGTAHMVEIAKAAHIPVWEPY